VHAVIPTLFPFPRFNNDAHNYLNAVANRNINASHTLTKIRAQPAHAKDQHGLNVMGIMWTKIQAKLPELFYLAELESSRAGKVGMEVGSARERILIAPLIYKFGQENVETNLPITEPEEDVKVFGNPISIKTISRYKPPRC